MNIRLFYLFIATFLSSCFHLHISKVPKAYISSVKNYITELSTLTRLTYTTDTIIEVDSVKNTELKSRLEAINVQYIEITYRTDSTQFTDAQLKVFNRSTSDSLIVFGKSKKTKGLHIDNWGTDKEVKYYFGRNKPKIDNWKDEFSDLIKKVNDSIYFARSHYPPSR